MWVSCLSWGLEGCVVNLMCLFGIMIFKKKLNFLFGAEKGEELKRKYINLKWD